MSSTKTFHHKNLFYNLCASLTSKIFKNKNMGTPLKQMRLLLSPKLLSPRSPVINRPRNVGRVAKRLEFSKTSCQNIVESGVKINVIKCESPKCSVNFVNNRIDSGRLQFKCLESIVPTEDDLLFLNSFSVGNKGKCGQNNKNLLLVNTPNKLDILRYGLAGGDYNVLGRGTFGTVVRGVYKGEDVAVKVVKTKSKLNEVNALKLRHKNIIQVKDVIMRNEKHSIIIMEFLKSSVQLQTVLNNESTLNWERIIQFSLGICEGLLYCHEHNVLHLDLKPLNILVCKDHCCKICDFGSSRIAGEIETDYTHEGSVAYTAPEILIGNKPTFASDIYSIGIILWQLRYKEIPFSSLLNKDVVIYKVVKYGLRPAPVEKPEILDDFHVLYKMCWSEVETERPSLAAIIKTLRVL